MADSALSDLKEVIKAQYQDEATWAVNKKLLRALGLFAGAIYMMRAYGDSMAI